MSLCSNEHELCADGVNLHAVVTLIYSDDGEVRVYDTVSVRHVRGESQRDAADALGDAGNGA